MSFSSKIISWYEQNKRDLPWRKTKDPYPVWLSEIILQQTRVEQGKSYFERFILHYPTVFDLANASEESVLKDWQGLGYYSRARNLHQTATAIVEKYNGTFPSEYEEILALKGIGSYTAAAISSICFDLPYPVIDGNVYRVLARVYGVELPIDQKEGQKRIAELAFSLIDENNPGTYNQAVMEFGALHCKPQSPDCSSCIFANSCEALHMKKVHELPLKVKKIRQRHRYFHYFVIRSNDNIYLKKRTESDIWQNLYDFPLIENEKKNP